MTTEITSLTQYANNPIRGLNYFIDQVEQTWFDQKANINSGTHPAVFAADLTIGMTFGFLNSLSDGISQVFSAHARSISELSRNMNDIELYGLFGTPSTSTAQLIIAMDNLIAFAPVAIDASGGISLNYQKLLVPKDTQFDVAGYTFGIENGIEIRYNERTGVQVVYDSTTNNPFNAISENVLKRRIKNISGKAYLIIDIPVRQLYCEAQDNIPSTQASGCSGAKTYTDFLYGVRAFITNNSGIKTEMSVTYDKAVFDPGTLTMTIDLDTSSNQFNYSIPDIYIENGLGIGTVSLYTYTTKGPVNKDFTDTDLRDYKPSYRDYRYASGGLNAYSDFLPNMGGVVWQFSKSINGGTVPNSFNRIKYGVVNGRRLRSLPITANNLIGSVEDYGYSAVKSIDFVTSRLFSLTKELPLQTNKGFFSGINSFIGTNLISAKNLVNSGVALDNLNRVTIPSGTLFDITTQEPTLMSKLQVNQLKQLTNNQLIAYMESRTLSYLPYHYVFDATNSQAAIRVYYLDNPSFGVQSFQEENTDLGIEVGVDTASVVYENNGYTLYVVTASGNSYKVLTDDQVGVQMSISVAGSAQLASLKGELSHMTTTGERIYRFRLESNLDVDDGDLIHITNLQQYGSVQADTAIPLDLDVSFIFLRTVGNWKTVISSDSDIDRSLFDSPMQAIIKTDIELTMGKRMQYLYNRIRPLVGEGQYEVYKYDIQNTYSENQYKYDNGKLVLDENSLPIILHRKGDLEFTDSGLPVWRYRKDDYVKDAEGNFIQLAPRELLYHWDFVGFDAVYMFSKDQYDLDFAQSIKDNISVDISGDMYLFSQLIIDKTRLLFQPKNKLSWKQVIVNSSYTSTLKQDLSFEVTYYLSSAGYGNTNLKATLQDNTPKVLNNFLFSNLTVATSKLVGALMANLPEDVIDVKINAISGDSSVDVISSTDSLSGFSVRKRLVLGDNKLPSIQEDVKVDFLQHDVKSV